jgi:hypothetical protein
MLCNKLVAIGIAEDSEIIFKKDIEESDNLSVINLPNFESITLNPTGILSCIAWMIDTTYRYLPKASRFSYLRNLATEMQADCDKLAGGPLARKRRKIYDWIGALSNKSMIKPDEWYDVFSGIAQMLHLQIIFVKMSKVEITDRDVKIGEKEEEDDNDTSKKIYFSSDPSKWSSDYKIYVVDYHARWIASPKDDSSLKDLVEWIDEFEVNGWDVQWFIDNAWTKEYIVNELTKNITWQPEHSKLKKDILARRLSRFNTISAVEKIIV